MEIDQRTLETLLGEVRECRQAQARIEARLDALTEPLANLQGIIEAIKTSPYAGMLGVQ